MSKKSEDYIKSIKTQDAELILKALEKGVVIWRQPWVYRQMNKGIDAKTPYRGVNIFTTCAAQLVFGYRSNLWVTWNRFIKLQKEYKNIRMKKGAIRIPLLIWSFRDVKDENGEYVLDDDGNRKQKPFMKVIHVFNTDEIENFETTKYAESLKADNSPEDLKTMSEIEDSLLSTYSNHPQVLHDSAGRSFYRITTDTVHIPPMEYFNGPAGFIEVLSHELAHSTGSAERLNRKSIAERNCGFADEEYSIEELIAEMASAMVASDYGMLEHTIENNAAYIKSWHDAIKDNPTWFWDAWKPAKKAYLMIVGKEEENNAECA